MPLLSFKRNISTQAECLKGLFSINGFDNLQFPSFQSNLTIQCQKFKKRNIKTQAEHLKELPFTNGFVTPSFKSNITNKAECQK
jgi:hypothetical protein